MEFIIIGGWLFSMIGYGLYKHKTKNNFKIQVFNVSDRVIKNKKYQSNINDRVKGIMGK